MNYFAPFYYNAERRTLATIMIFCRKYFDVVASTPRGF